MFEQYLFQQWERRHRNWILKVEAGSIPTPCPDIVAGACEKFWEGIMGRLRAPSLSPAPLGMLNLRDPLLLLLLLGIPRLSLSRPAPPLPPDWGTGGRKSDPSRNACRHYNYETEAHVRSLLSGRKSWSCISRVNQWSIVFSLIPSYHFNWQSAIEQIACRQPLRSEINAPPFIVVVLVKGIIDLRVIVALVWWK